MAKLVRTRIAHIDTRAWFPPGSDIATTMARLCILREDLYLELRGMVWKPIPELDEHSMQYRTIYSFRNALRTLMEIDSAFAKLNQNKTFTSKLKTQPKEIRDSVNALSKALNASHELVKQLRNDVSAHLLHVPFAKGLERIVPGTMSLIQVGNRPADVHYKFALEILGAVMLRDVDVSKAEGEWDSILKTTTKLAFQAIRGIDMLFMAYVDVSGLQL